MIFQPVKYLKNCNKLWTGVLGPRQCHPKMQRRALGEVLERCARALTPLIGWEKHHFSLGKSCQQRYNFFLKSYWSKMIKVLPCYNHFISSSLDWNDLKGFRFSVLSAVQFQIILQETYVSWIIICKSYMYFLCVCRAPALYIPFGRYSC